MADITTFVYFHAMRKLGSSPIRSGETSFTDFPYWLCTPLSKAKAKQDHPSSAPNRSLLTDIGYSFFAVFKIPLSLHWLVKNGMNAVLGVSTG